MILILYILKLIFNHNKDEKYFQNYSKLEKTCLFILNLNKDNLLLFNSNSIINHKIDDIINKNFNYDEKNRILIEEGIIESGILRNEKEIILKKNNGILLIKIDTKEKNELFYSGYSINNSSFLLINNILLCISVKSLNNNTHGLYFINLDKNSHKFSETNQFVIHCFSSLLLNNNVNNEGKEVNFFLAAAFDANKQEKLLLIRIEINNNDINIQIINEENYYYFNNINYKEYSKDTYINYIEYIKTNNQINNILLASSDGNVISADCSGINSYINE